MKGTSGNMPAQMMIHDFSPSSGYNQVFTAYAVCTKAGWLAQVVCAGLIVWESKHVYEEQCDAITKANKHIAKKLSAIFE